MMNTVSWHHRSIKTKTRWNAACICLWSLPRPCLLLRVLDSKMRLQLSRGTYIETTQTIYLHCLKQHQTLLAHIPTPVSLVPQKQSLESLSLISKDLQFCFPQNSTRSEIQNNSIFMNHVCQLAKHEKHLSNQEMTTFLIFPFIS